MAVNLSPLGGVGAQFFDNSGNPLTGGKIYTYAAGTTTPQTAYTSSTGSTPHTNPIILDAAGRVPGGEIWLTDGLQYKFVLKTSVDVLIATYDNIVGINSNFINYTSEQEIQTATAGQTVFTLTTMQYQPGTNSLSVFVDGVNQYGPGAQYAYVETDATTVTFISGLHVGASVKFTTSAINAASYGDAFQISYTPPFTGSVATNVGDKLAQYVSVKDFGAVGDGVANDTAAIQAALSASNYVIIPQGIYAVSTTITITADTTLVIQGTIKPYANPGSTIPFFSASASNVNIIFEGGKIDGISTSYDNFTSGIYVSGGASTRLTNVNVIDGKFENIGIDNGGTAISYDGVSNSKITGNFIENCGQVSNLTFAGGGIYLQYCTSIVVENNTLKTVGASGITNSGGVNCVIANNKLDTITLFGFKGGYIPSVTTTTADVTPSVNSFSVTRSAAVLRNLQLGQAVLVMNAAYPAALGYIGAITDNTTYLTIFLNAPMNAVPDVGAQLQILETGTVYTGNTVRFTGDNGWDINGYANITATNNNLYAPGVYQGAGVFGGLACGFWFGYDPQGGYNKFITQDLLVSSNSIVNSYGSSISVQATSNNVNISNNLITNPNRSNNASFGGIDCNQYTYYRSNNQIISGNIITNALNFAIFNNYGSNVSISNNQIYSNLGVNVSAQQGCVVENNNITTTSSSATAYGVLVSTTGVSNSSVVVANNIISVVNGYGIRNTDAGFSLNTAFNGNIISGSGTFTAFSNNGGDEATPTSVNGANQFERHTSQFATGQTITFATIVATTANVFLLAVHSEASANVGLTGLYLVSRSGTGTLITTISACADVSVALNASKQITVTNTTGANRTLAASISVLQ